MKSKIISIVMAKGGVGKSVSAINLGFALSQAGNKVLLIDNDSQGSLSLALGHNPSQLRHTLSNVILSVLDSGEVSGVNEALIKISDNIDLIPANSRLAAIQNRLISEKSDGGLYDNEGSIPPERIYKTILSGLRERYSYTIIDCAPGLSILITTIVLISILVLVLSLAQFLRSQGLAKTIEDVWKVYENFLNGNLEVEEGEYRITINEIFDFDREEILNYNQYALFDINEDGIPELHVRSVRCYYILTYKDDELAIWHTYTPYNYPLNNGAIFYMRPGGAPTHINYAYEVCDFDGNLVFRVDFSRYDEFEEENLKGDALFIFDGVEVSKEDWDLLTEEYFAVGADLIEWQVYK